MAALATLYHSTNGPNWTDNTNWLSDAPVEEWHGVNVDGDGRVTELILADNRLSGPIPPELSGLTNLRRLQLNRNELSGEIPPELGDLTNLRHLQLNRNELSGAIPPELGDLANLRHLELNRNELSGAIPPELGDLANLMHLQLNGNELTGEIPLELSNLADLTDLRLAGNRLSGEIPPELNRLANLATLQLDSNLLSGEIPVELGSLSNLTALSISYNRLSGDIPPELGSLPNLTSLSLNNNRLSGGIPPELGDLANLMRLHLDDNYLSEEIPAELGNLVSLTHLWLHRNQLSGEIPAELGSLANLTSLRLQRNHLSGEIPSELGVLANLTHLQLDDNYLSGKIPMELGGLFNLEYLWLSHNQLSGPIPPEVGGLANLIELWLHANRLSGAIPPELGSLVNLTELRLSHNQLSGEIPPELGDLFNLTALSLGWNRLSGEVPPGLVNLPNLTEAQLEGNGLIGEIPTELQSTLPVRVESQVVALPSPESHPAISLEAAFGGRKFDRPIELGAYPVGPDGSGAGMFVADQEGLILLLRADGSEVVELLDISDQVSTESVEEGLLSVALDPWFEETGHLWLYYAVEGGPRRTRLSRFTVSLDELRRVDPGSELVILEVNQPGEFHKGGSIRFGSDGMLYLAFGESGQRIEAQRLDSLLGSVIRIDVRESSVESPYTVPSDNPFVDTPGARPEIWAFGFRNPWRMAFDPATGTLWAGDVGQADIEEINHVEAGGNYGWNRFEGTRCVYPDAGCSQFGLIPPVVEYKHEPSCAVVGGVVYRGEAVPALVGHYLFSDYCARRLWALSPDGGNVIEAAIIARGVSSFGVDADGEVYVLTFGGAVLRIAPL